MAPRARGVVSVAFDVITMGRISVDVYPLQVGVSLREVESFGKYLGGSPSNVAVAAAQYGRDVALITRTGEDPALRLDDARWRKLVFNVERAAEIARDRGYEPVFHHHTSTYVEGVPEIVPEY